MYISNALKKVVLIHMLKEVGFYIMLLLNDKDLVNLNIDLLKADDMKLWSFYFILFVVYNLLMNMNVGGWCAFSVMVTVIAILL